MKYLSLILLFWSLNGFGIEKLSWEDCLKHAKSNNPDLKTSELDIANSQSLLEVSKSGFWPQLTGNLSYANESRTSSLLSSDFSTTSGASLVLSQNLFSGFLDVYKYSKASLNKKLAEINQVVTKAQIIYDLKNSFYTLAYSKNYLKLAKDIKARRETNQKMVQLRFEGGRENKGSLLLAKASTSQSALDILQGEHSLQEALQKLSQMVGVALSTDIQLQIPQNSKSLEAEPAFEKIVEDAPEFLQIKIKEQMSASEVKIAQANYYPTINANYTIGKNGANWPPESDKWSAGITLNIPIFSGGRDYYNEKAAYASWLSASFNKESMKDKVLVKIKKAYHDTVEAYEKYKVDKEFLDAALVRAEIARSKYNNGLIAFEDWDMVESDLIQRQKTFLESEKNKVMFYATYLQLLGDGDNL